MYGLYRGLKQDDIITDYVGIKSALYSNFHRALCRGLLQDRAKYPIVGASHGKEVGI